jgi:hypothetical protein
MNSSGPERITPTGQLAKGLPEKREQIRLTQLRYRKNRLMVFQPGMVQTNYIGLNSGAEKSI